MNRSERSVVVGALILWCAVLGLLCVVHTITRSGVKAFLIEGLCDGVIICGMLIFRPVRAFLTRLPKPHITILASFIFLMALGQWLGTPNGSRATFPFVAWTMYSTIPKSGTVEFYECVGLTEEGEEIVLHPARIFRPLVSARIHHLLVELIKGVKAESEAEPGLPSEGELFPFQSVLKSSPRLEFIRTALRGKPDYSRLEYTGQLEGMLRGIAHAYNARHKEALIHTVHVFWCRRFVSDGPNPQIDRQMFMRVRVEHAS